MQGVPVDQFSPNFGGANTSSYSITVTGEYLVDANGMGHASIEIKQSIYGFITLKIFLNLLK